MPAAEPDDRSRVILAQVRARLLGLQLLTVDARIDVGPPGSWADLREVPAIPRRQARRARRRSRGFERGRLRRAAVLLAEGDQRLDEARGLRHRLERVEPGAQALGP
jgi:hypothetical protein